MGGALAQYCAAYYAHVSPVLVSFGMPSIGNSEFVSFVEANVLPTGGIRVYNEGDIVPEITKLVGYLHAGAPICLYVKDSAKDLYTDQCINEIVSNYDAVAPHIMFQIGSLVYCLPGGIGVKEYGGYDADWKPSTDVAAEDPADVQVEQRDCSEACALS